LVERSFEQAMTLARYGSELGFEAFTDCHQFIQFGHYPLLLVEGRQRDGIGLDGCN
jgi:hypothetical protein